MFYEVEYHVYHRIRAMASGAMQQIAKRVDTLPEFLLRRLFRLSFPMGNPRIDGESTNGIRFVVAILKSCRTMSPSTHQRRWWRDSDEKYSWRVSCRSCPSVLIRHFSCKFQLDSEEVLPLLEWQNNIWIKLDSRICLWRRLFVPLFFLSWTLVSTPDWQTLVD